MNQVVITGITGKSGQYMYKELVANAEKLTDFKFRFAIRESSNRAQFANSSFNMELCVGDLEDEQYLHKLCENSNTLVHIAGIQKSLKIVKAAVDSGINRLILVHTTGIYSKYKAAGEEYRQIDKKIHTMIKDKNISLTILRPTMIYGNLHDGNISIFIKMIDKLHCFPVVDHATYQLQPVWCGDLGKAYYQVLLNPETTKNKEYNLSGGKPIYLIDIFKTIASYLGRKNIFISFPYWFSYSGAWLLYICTLSKYDFREKVQRLVEPRTFDHTKATNDFGYMPVEFSTGIKEEVEMYKTQIRKE